MKVYLTYDKEGWEILGVDKIFIEKEKAIEYLTKCYSLTKKKITLEQYIESELFEKEVI